MNDATSLPPFVCPACKGHLEHSASAYTCSACGRSFPVLCGIPDFRLQPDRYIPIEDDRRKGALLEEQAANRTFSEMLEYYYSITPEVPRHLALKFTAHALAEPGIAAFSLDQMKSPSSLQPLLDIGCSTGGMVVAAARRFISVAGVDVAFRWLVVGKVRLREAGVRAPLVCANAESLPFADDSFFTVTVTDLLEHVADPSRVAAESRRVLRKNGRGYFSTNNRYSLLPEPHTKVWGVGWLPRSVQARYVRVLSGGSYRNIALRSARELAWAARSAGFASWKLRPAPLFAPNGPQAGLTMYNRARRLSAISSILRMIGPRLELICQK